MGQDVFQKTRGTINNTVMDAFFPNEDAYVRYAQQYGYENKSKSDLRQLGLSKTGSGNINSYRGFVQQGKNELDDIEKAIPRIINGLQDLQKEKEKIFSDKENLQLEETQDRIKLLNSALQQEKSRRDEVSKALKEQITNGENALRLYS